MAYKKHMKRGIKEAKTPDKAVIEILSEGQKTQSEIHDIIKEKPHDLPLSRMGLWKILDKLEKKDEIEKKDIGGVFVFQNSHKSKILAEFCGIGFRSSIRGNFFVKDGLDIELGITKKEKINSDVLMRFFGFYVLYSIIASRTLPKERRSDWLGSVLDLEKSIPMSEFFEAFVDKNEETVKKITTELKKKYKKNFGYMSQAFLDTTYHNLKNKNPKFSKENKDFVEKLNF